MNADGTQMTKLTHYPENNSSAKDFGYRAGAAKWHPSENFISYISLQGRKAIDRYNLQITTIAGIY